MRRLALLALTTSVACSTEDAPPSSPAVPTFSGSFHAVDDGAAFPGFVAFRDALRQSVADRDTAALLAAVAPGAKLSFGDQPGGRDGFRTMWFSGEPPEGEVVWDVLGRVLEHGSVEEDGSLTAPYVYGMWPSDSLDAFSSVAVVGENVPAYEQPRGRVVARLADLIVPIRAPPLEAWWQVELPDGRAAYVRRTQALSPVGYRAGFWDDGAGYQLHFLVAGD